LNNLDQVVLIVSTIQDGAALGRDESQAIHVRVGGVDQRSAMVPFSWAASYGARPGDPGMATERVGFEHRRWFFCGREVGPNAARAIGLSELNFRFRIAVRVRPPLCCRVFSRHDVPQNWLTHMLRESLCA